MIIIDMRLNEALKVALVENDHVIQKFSPDAASNGVIPQDWSGTTGMRPR